jgi:N-acetylglutamate synthase-like GNAT family acetyltransferase
MDKITICRAEEKDSSYIKEKVKKYALDATNIDWRHFFVAKQRGKTVAFGRIIDYGDYFELASLGVDYYQRGKGIGVMLLRFLIEEAKRQGKGKPIYGVTHRPGFLEKVGFKEVNDYPEELKYKRDHKCRLDPAKIKIMRLVT